MKKFISTTLMIAVFSTLAFSQKLTQTVRGTIIDTDSRLPLIGATVVILVPIRRLVQQPMQTEISG